MFEKLFEKVNNPKRHLTQNDLDSWDKSADQRKPPKNREQIIERVRVANPVRWWRIQNDYKWLQRQMKKMGYNPEDARELL